MPEALLVSLHRAAVRGDVAELLALSGEVGIQHGALGEQLRGLVEAFAFDAIIAATGPAEKNG